MTKKKNETSKTGTKIRRFEPKEKKKKTNEKDTQRPDHKSSWG